MSVRDQAFATLVLPAPGVLSWSTFNRIVMEWGTTETTEAFALIAWPETTLPLYVRANGTRYKLSGTIVGEPLCGSVPGHRGAGRRDCRRHRTHNFLPQTTYVL